MWAQGKVQSLGPSLEVTIDQEMKNATATTQVHLASAGIEVGVVLINGA